MSTCYDDRIYVIGVRETHAEPRATHLSFLTTRGDFPAILQMPKGAREGVIMLTAGKVGPNGPGSLYAKFADDLFDEGIASLRLDHRVPGDCVQCAIDALLSLQFMDDEGVHDVALVGWSFGGAVALSAGSVARTVQGIAALSTVDVANCCVKRLQSKPILLLHGEADRVSPIEVPRRIYSEAQGSRRLILYPGSGHTLVEAKEQVHQDLRKWVLHMLKASRLAA
ncbi:MAG: dienelactone hydrolase family protein [Armatimonadetes bacterium]|nr:dienelactone hydrolase family protein [Armatimonadota bacterium]